MTKNYLLCASLILVTTFFCGCDDDGKHWQRAARQDLDFMRAQILENHPGPVNVEDPNFTKNLDHAYQAALDALDHVASHDDYSRVVEAFAGSFNDKHLRIGPLKEEAKKTDKKDKQEAVAFDEIAPQVAWIRIPTFEPDETKKEQFGELLKMLSHLRHYKAIVFDLHGNTGGNSAWGRYIIEELFSPSYLQQQRCDLWERVSLDYRVSPANLAHIKTMAQDFAKDFGKESELVQGYENFYKIMKTALERGEALVRVPKGDYKLPIKQVLNPVSAPIFVIIDRKCASACLDFIDELKCQNHPVVLFGEQTAADTFYMEVRDQKLPSGQGKFVFPIKVYRNRPRGNNEAYRPDIPYADDLNDTRRVAEAIYRLVLRGTAR